MIAAGASRRWLGATFRRCGISGWRGAPLCVAAAINTSDSATGSDVVLKAETRACLSFPRRAGALVVIARDYSGFFPPAWCSLNRTVRRADVSPVVVGDGPVQHRVEAANFSWSLRFRGRIAAWVRASA
jgi:hypothetical protein